MRFSRAFIQACKHSRCHLVAIEGDFAIFDAKLAPLCKYNPFVTCGSVLDTTTSQMMMNPFRWWPSDHTSISKFGIACRVTCSPLSCIQKNCWFMYIIISFGVCKRMIVNASSPPSLMLFPSHIVNMTKAMATI